MSRTSYFSCLGDLQVVHIFRIILGVPKMLSCRKIRDQGRPKGPPLMLSAAIKSKALTWLA